MFAPRNTCEARKLRSSTSCAALLPGAVVLTPASLFLSSTTPCQLWLLDACVLHQRTIFLFSRAYPICLSSSRRRHTVSSTPCQGAWTSAPLSVHLSAEWECTVSQIETPNYTCRTTTHQYIWQQQKCSAVGESSMELRSGRTTLQDHVLSPRHRHPFFWNGPAKNSVFPA